MLSVLFFLLLVFPMVAFASTKTISGVTIRVQNKLEAGDTLSSSDVVYGDPSDGEAGVSISSDRCFISDAKFVTGVNKTLKIGDEIKIRVRLEPMDDSSYVFKGTYSSSNVKISGGEFVSASKSGGDLLVTVKLKAIKGTYDPPQDAEWKDSTIGRAKWTAPDYSSGHYEVVLRRNGTEVCRKTDVSALSYNFYPYMTKAGTYTFRVRTVSRTSSGTTYGKASEWTESDEYYLDAKHVSDGSGQGDGSTDGTSAGSAGWEKSGSIWYYKYPDGSYKKNGWEVVDGKWYMFDSTGKMMTGWQTTSSGTYFLSDSGSMLTGWQNLSNSWYYLDPNPDSPTQGAMQKNTKLTVDGNTYYLMDKGQMASGWTKVDGHWSYFDPGTGIMQKNKTINTFYVDGNGIWQQN